MDCCDVASFLPTCRKRPTAFSHLRPRPSCESVPSSTAGGGSLFCSATTGAAFSSVSATGESDLYTSATGCSTGATGSDGVVSASALCTGGWLRALRFFGGGGGGIAGPLVDGTTWGVGAGAALLGSGARVGTVPAGSRITR